MSVKELRKASKEEKEGKKKKWRSVGGKKAKN